MKIKVLQHKNKRPTNTFMKPFVGRLFYLYMPLTGIEPARDCSHIDLNDARLPIPPQRQNTK